MLKVTCFTFLASGGYVIYRRRLWNKPQTLSDKCSNADSSGYIDDSTIRVSSFKIFQLPEEIYTDKHKQGHDGVCTAYECNSNK